MDIYQRYSADLGFTIEILDEDFGHHCFKVTGKGAGKIFSSESGKHCVQRIPGNDRSGRRQTSFVNVAVLPLPPIGTSKPLPQSEIVTTVQTGRQRAGGQNANKVASAVRMKHIPTGLSVFINSRDQLVNKQEALRILTAKVNNQRIEKDKQEYSAIKSSQLSDRGRGGKVRTYNFIDGYVLDHNTNKRTNDVKSVMKGKLQLVL